MNSVVLTNYWRKNGYGRFILDSLAVDLFRMTAYRRLDWKFVHKTRGIDKLTALYINRIDRRVIYNSKMIVKRIKNRFDDQVGLFH